jgi:hypothetical protein
LYAHLFNKQKRNDSFSCLIRISKTLLRSQCPDQNLSQTSREDKRQAKKM